MKMRFCIVVCFISVGILPGSAILDIGTGLTIETSGDICVQADQLAETGSGYLKGQVNSGSRTGMTEFAGLSLCSGLSGSITR